MGKIDISTEEKKKEIFEIFNKLNSKNQIHIFFNISDNKKGSDYIKEIANEIGFDLNVYKERKRKICLNCGKELKKGQTKFCSSSCSATFNNKLREVSIETKEKISNTLKTKNACKIHLKYEDFIEKQDNTKICLECGKKINNNQKIFCSSDCCSNYKHKKSYEDFLRNNDKYCRPNYSAKNFKDFIINEQEGVCAICGLHPKWNNKNLNFILDHIDGNASNNKRENLRCICPNCDSQLDTFKSKNKYSSRRNYWKEKIIKDLQKQVV